VIGLRGLEVHRGAARTHKHDATLKPDLVVGDGKQQANVHRGVQRRRGEELERDPSAVKLHPKRHERILGGQLDGDPPDPAGAGLRADTLPVRFQKPLRLGRQLSGRGSYVRRGLGEFSLRG
jgi:hypothetical protein